MSAMRCALLVVRNANWLSLNGMLVEAFLCLSVSLFKCVRVCVCKTIIVFFVSISFTQNQAPDCWRVYVFLNFTWLRLSFDLVLLCERMMLRVVALGMHFLTLDST